jgi:hypothetical protein
MLELLAAEPLQECQRTLLECQRSRELAVRAFLLLVGLVFSLLGLAWKNWITTKYLREALARGERLHTEQQRSLIADCFSRCNQMQRDLLQTFLQEPTPTLRDLVERTDREFSARASVRRSEVDESTTTFRPR